MTAEIFIAKWSQGLLALNLQRAVEEKAAGMSKPNPPAYEPTHCDGCGVVIKLSDGGCSQGPKGILCQKCTRKAFPISKLD